MILQADARHIPLADESVHSVVTSPPYWGLRDYGIEASTWGGREDCAHEWGKSIEIETGRNDTDPETLARRAAQYTTGTGNGSAVGKQTVTSSFCSLCSAWRGTLGLEPDPGLYVEHIVEVFREVKRVLRKDGTCWVNLGDSYAGGQGRWGGYDDIYGKQATNVGSHSQGYSKPIPTGLKPKDLVGIPWRVAFALQADGWWLRSDIIWSKPNPMPESVTDRPTKSHEYIFLLAKSETYFYDAEAIKERCETDPSENYPARAYITGRNSNYPGNQQSASGGFPPNGSGRNKRTVWTVATQPYPDAHFATFPEDLIKPCILAGTSARGCCAECGAPWERVTESGEWVKDDNGLGRRQDIKQLQIKKKGATSAFRTGGHFESKTLGGQPTCSCEEVKAEHANALGYEQLKGPYPTKPCIVLDPFAGSGTTIKVAQDLGRVGIGLEIKADYISMAKIRAQQLGLMV